MPDGDPERKYSENPIKSKTGDPCVVVCRVVTVTDITHFNDVAVVPCHIKTLGKCL